MGSLFVPYYSLLPPLTFGPFLQIVIDFNANPDNHGILFQLLKYVKKELVQGAASSQLRLYQIYAPQTYALNSSDFTTFRSSNISQSLLNRL
jgi:hypothetical protein